MSVAAQRARFFLVEEGFHTDFRFADEQLFCAYHARYGMD